MTFEEKKIFIFFLSKKLRIFFNIFLTPFIKVKDFDVLDIFLKVYHQAHFYKESYLKRFPKIYFNITFLYGKIVKE